MVVQKISKAEFNPRVLEAIRNKIINKYRRCKNPSKQQQKAERLLHDKKFLEEVKIVLVHFGDDFFMLRALPMAKQKKIIKSNPILKYNPPGADYEFRMASYVAPQLLGIEGQIAQKCKLLELMQLRWRQFCGDRHIDHRWDGNLDSLGDYADPPIKIYPRDIPYIGKKKIIIEIDERATEKAVRARWSEVEKLQNEFLSGKTEDRPNYGRDLCWYDLKQAGFPIAEIARVWLKSFPGEVELLALGGFKKSYPKELSEAVKGRVFEDAVLIKEIKSGGLTDDLKQAFKKVVGLYAPKLKLDKPKKRSKTPHRDSTKDKERKTFTAIEEVINKAITRMDDDLKKPWKFPETKIPFSIDTHK